MKRILYISSGILVGLFVLGKRKYNSVIAILNNLRVNIVGIRNFDINIQRIQFEAQLEIINPTQNSLTLNTYSSVELKSVEVFTIDGQFLGMAQADISEIEIQPQSSYILPFMKYNVPTSGILNNINNIETLYNPQNLALKFVLNVLGKRMVIDV